MTVRKLTVSLDPEVVLRVRREVADGRAESVSAWLNEAAEIRLESEDLASVLADLFEATGGPITDAELDEARRRITAAERP